jgi:phosphatidylinositol phospholipase C delta
MSRKQGIVPELAALMIYTAGVKYRGFSKLVEYKAEEMFSVSEKVGTKILRATPLDFIKHNRAHLSRVYPNGTRLTSTNYLPHHFWAMGAQLVALNWQTCGKPESSRLVASLKSLPGWGIDVGFAFNAAMFARNGRSGYILKPDALRSRNKELLAQKERHILQLTVRHD